MFIIRPIKNEDLEGLVELLKHSGHGLTSLPQDEDVLKRRVAHSVRSFEQKEKDRPGGELYLFVMEELFTGKIIGVSGIISKIGGFEPYYFYQLEKETHRSKFLNVENNVTAMHLKKVYNGPAEICSLFLAPNYRSSQNGRFLSLTRFLYVASNLEIFEQEFIAEMRGQVDKEGNSPFWEAVGKKFFKIAFPEADLLTMKNKSFIEELLPDYPIILELLPDEAQSVVSQVHKNTVPALRILKQEGFKVSNMVGIFEPGPIVTANIKKVRTVRDSKLATIKEIGNLSPEEQKMQPFIISTLDTQKFKACLGSVVDLGDGNIGISDVTATALKLKLNQKIRYVTLKKPE